MIPKNKTSSRKILPTTRIGEIRGLQLARDFLVDPSSIDQATRSVWMAAATEEPVMREWGLEILEITTQAIDASRLLSGAPLLVDHDPVDHVGVIEEFVIGSDRKLRVLARFSRSARGEEVFRDVLDGIRCNTSIGYIIDDAELVSQDGNTATYRITSWTPLECSLVSIPADPFAGVGRSKSHNIEENNMTTSRSDQIRAKNMLTASPADLENQRVNAILSTGDEFRSFGGVEIARELIKDRSATVETLRLHLAARLRATPATPLDTSQGGFGPFGGASYSEPVLYGQGGRQMVKTPRYFKGPNAERNAYAAGQWLRGVYGKEDARRWCDDNGISIRAMSSATNAQGGALVPDPLSNAIIDLSDSYGAFRQNSDVWPMQSDTLPVPRSTSDPDASFVGESDAINEDEGTMDIVRLNARKIGTIVRIPSELMEDAVIDLADRSALQIARSFSKKEDECGFMGDGTSTYGGMRGIFKLLVDGSHNAGKVTAAANHDTFSEIDASDLAALVATCPEYALEGAKFYCSGTAWGLVFMRLMMAAGGNSISDISASVQKSYGGFPVVTTPILPAGNDTDYSGQTMIAFGNLRLASKLGSRREIRIQILTERYAEYDQVGVKATERFHIVNHDLGDNTKAGPVVGLIGN